MGQRLGHLPTERLEHGFLDPSGMFFSSFLVIHTISVYCATALLIMKLQIYRGVRVGGLQQALQHFQYMGSPHVPGDFPDSLAGAQSALDKEAQLLEKYTK